MRRLLDLLCALALLPFSFILIVPCCIAILLIDGRPIFFRSQRLGKNKEIFTIYKLRTMKPSTPLTPTHTKNVSAYVTKLGKFLRLTSLDELPQIFNILNGSMTFIGPRPCLRSELELIKARENKKIFIQIPGITGLAQIRGRDTNSIRNKVRYESFYLRKESFLFNLSIILSTLRVVFKFSDISH